MTRRSAQNWMYKDEPDCCGNCQCYVGQECRRFPPSIDKNNCTHGWPCMVDGRAWCAEHMRIPEPVEQEQSDAE